MCLIDDYDRPDMLNALQYLDLAVQSSLVIAATEAIEGKLARLERIKKYHRYGLQSFYHNEFIYGKSLMADNFKITEYARIHNNIHPTQNISINNKFLL